MPKKLHRLLTKAARKKGLKQNDFERYVYGGMQKLRHRSRKGKHTIAKP